MIKETECDICGEEISLEPKNEGSERGGMIGKQGTRHYDEEEEEYINVCLEHVRF